MSIFDIIKLRDRVFILSDGYDFLENVEIDIEERVYIISERSLMNRKHEEKQIVE